MGTKGNDIAHVGDIIAGKFRVERVLGEGGMGRVLEATHLLLDERVALKFLRREVLTRADIVARFAQEARAAAKLKSEHVARVLDVGEDRAAPYIVMEYLEGENLEELLARKGPLSVSEAVELLIQAAEGISEAHARGIIHRDIKPANLFLARRTDGWTTLKILDFGISKAALNTKGGVDLAAGPGKTMSLLGSPYYMSPEQLQSTRDVDRRTDVWALGAVLFELLSGKTAFSSTELLPLATEIMEKPHRRLRDFCPDAPEELEAIIARALAKDRAQRYQSAGELALALLPFTQSKRSRVIVTQAITITRSSGIDPTLPLPSSIPDASNSGGLPAPGRFMAPSVPHISASPSSSTGPLADTPKPRVSPTDPTLHATPVAVAHPSSSETLSSNKSTKSRLLIVSAALAAVIGIGIGAFELGSRVMNRDAKAPPPPLTSLPPAVSLTLPVDVGETPTALTDNTLTPEAPSASVSAYPQRRAEPVATALPSPPRKRAAPPPASSAPTHPRGDLDIRRER